MPSAFAFPAVEWRLPWGPSVSPERAEAEAHWGVQPLGFLDRAGWLRPGTALTHGTGLRPDEVRLMAERGVALVHCPRTVVRL